MEKSNDVISKGSPIVFKGSKKNNGMMSKENLTVFKRLNQKRKVSGIGNR